MPRGDVDGLLERGWDRQRQTAGGLNTSGGSNVSLPGTQRIVPRRSQESRRGGTIGDRFPLTATEFVMMG